MKTSLIKPFSALFAIGILLLMIAWMAGALEQKISPGRSQPAPLVEQATIAVKSLQRPRYEPVPATIKAKQATQISSRILARIEKVHVRAGDTVRRGQLLLELEKTDLQSRVSQAEASIRAIEARLLEARQTLQRARDLNQSGVIATADLERAQANHDALIANHNNAEQALKEAQTALTFADVRAPIDGRIVDRTAEPGDTVQPGSPLLSLYNPLSLRVEAHVREQLALSLQLDQALSVTIPATNQQMTSVIEERVPAGNPGSRSFLIKSRLPENSQLLPGMYARLQLPAGDETLLVAPQARVAHIGQLDLVWVLHQGVAERRFVRLGKQIDALQVEIISGLQVGDRLLPVPR